jgi:hypothetical protein
MARPKPKTPRVLISLRVTPGFLQLVDQARGKQSRAAYLEGLALMGVYKALAKAADGPPAAMR